MRDAVDRATQKLQRSATLLKHRRLNWNVETNHRIRWEFEAFVRHAREASFPLALHVDQHDTPNEGVVQITVQRLLTGTVHRKHNADFVEDSFVDTPVVETGGEFIASQSATGYVHFIMHPRRSDRIKPKETEIILLRPYEPTEVTVKVIRKALKQYLVLLQSSSILGNNNALTLTERLLVMWIRFRDLRNRYVLYRSLLSLSNEWGKAIIAGAIALIIGYITATKP